MTVFEIRLPITGSRPARKVSTISVLVSGSRTPSSGSTHDQVDGGEHRVERRDAHLGEDDAPERLAEPAGPLGQRLGQRRARRRPRAISLQRDHGADHHADQRVEEAPPDLGAERLQLPGVLAQPGHPFVLQLVGVGGELGWPARPGGAPWRFRGCPPSGRAAPAGSPCAAARKNAMSADDREGQRGDDEHRQEGDRHALPGLPAAADERQPARQDVHQLVDREPAQQRRQQVQMEDQEQRQGGEDPGGDLGGRGTGPRPGVRGGLRAFMASRLLESRFREVSYPRGGRTWPCRKDAPPSEASEGLRTSSAG